ncbi:hypothetical protein [Sphingomonas soli]|uniref:hypothetical protein n=1 Tax=Sphingomonas soli TaxID=266127 RepID=UPI000836C820|nr:hypothetical protein [Sphingomonas soli]
MRTLMLLALLAPIPAAAQDFNCRNLEAEIACDAGKCTVTGDQGFTPMGLTRRGNMLSICAYSGCSEGRVLVSRSRGGIAMLYAEVRRTTGPGGEREPLAVLYDRTERTAQMRWRGFSNAMSCG